MTDSPKSAEETTFLAVVTEHNPVKALTVEADRKALISHIEKEVKEQTFDLSTAAGRDECRSFAAKITRTKTTLDKTATALTEEWRKKTAAVNAERRVLVDRLDELAKQARQPLTDWETAEEQRVLKVETTLRWLTGAAAVEFDATAADVEARIVEVEAVDMDTTIFLGALENAEKAKAHTLEVLRSALARIKEAEAQKAELERLRAEAVERQQAEEAREAAARADQERREREARETGEAEERRRREAEMAAAAEKARVAHIESMIEHIKEVGAGTIGGQSQPLGILVYELESKVEIDDSFGDRREEVEKLRVDTLGKLRAALDQERAQQAEQARQREEQAAREADERARSAAAAARAEEERREAARREAAERDAEHRKRCKSEAKAALMSCGADEQTAKNIVLAILANEIPRINLDFAAEPAVRSSREAFEEARESAPEAAAADQMERLV